VGEIYNQCMGFKFFVCCQNCTFGWTGQIYLKLVYGARVIVTSLYGSLQGQREFMMGIES